MYSSNAYSLERCIFLCYKLQQLCTNDQTEIDYCLTGEQTEKYRNILRTEEEKLSLFSTQLQRLYDAAMLM